MCVLCPWHHRTQIEEEFIWRVFVQLLLALKVRRMCK